MRIALLTAMARSHETDRRHAMRRFLGRSVLSHQIDCAIAFGCTSIYCLVDGVGQDIVDCQHRAERAGARFQTIGSTHSLAKLVRPEDKVIALADGLLVDPDVLAEELHDEQAVLTFPIDNVAGLGFERLDADRAWAGALVVGGDKLEALRQLPPDADAASALVRIALQSGAATIPLDPAILTRGQWGATVREDGLAAREQAWIGRQVTPAGFAAPGNAVADRIGLRLARDLIGRRGERVPMIAALCFGLLSGLAAILGKPIVGLALALPMMVTIPIAAVIEKVSLLGKNEGSLPAGLRILMVAADFLIVALVALALPPVGAFAWLRLFVPVVLILALHNGARFAPPAIRLLCADRIVLLAILILGAITGILLPLAAGLVVLVLLAMMARRITAD